MSENFIQLNEMPRYLDQRLWDICTASIVEGTQYADLALPCVKRIRAWSSDIRHIPRFIEYHGLSGLTNTLFENHQIGVPLLASMTIKASSAKHQGRWKAINEVLGLTRNKAARGIRFCLLKGSALATQIYSFPYHRAMSDVDIMCSPDNALRLYNQCLDAGFEGPSIDKYSSSIHHHLPAISKKVGQHQIFLEIHTHALSHDLGKQLYWRDINSKLRTISVEDEGCLTLHHEAMLFQLCMHAFARDQVIKLSNIVDIFRYAIFYENEIDWNKLMNEFPQAILTMRYALLLLTLPDSMLPQIKRISPEESKSITGLGEGMMPLREFSNSSMSVIQRLQAVFFPSPWWQRVFYGVEPRRSVSVFLTRKLSLKTAFTVRYLIHPFRVVLWVVKKQLPSKLLS